MPAKLRRSFSMGRGKSELEHLTRSGKSNWSNLAFSLPKLPQFFFRVGRDRSIFIDKKIYIDLDKISGDTQTRVEIAKLSFLEMFIRT